MPAVEGISPQPQQPSYLHASEAVHPQAVKLTAAITPGAASRPVAPQRAPTRLNNGGLLATLIARKRSSTGGTSTQGDREFVEADDFRVSVPVLAERRSGNGGESGSSDSPAQSFVNVPTHAAAGAEFQTIFNDPSTNQGAMFERQIEAAQSRLDAIAAVGTRQPLIDALDGVCIELMERAGQLVRAGFPTAVVARLLAAGMSELYVRYAPDLPTDLSQIVGKLRQRALTLVDMRGTHQDAPPSAHALYASLPIMWFSSRSGRRDQRARLAS